METTTPPQGLSPEAAERLLAAIRQKARETDIRRAQWRYARLGKTGVGTEW